MPPEGLEPPRHRWQQILSLQRLPFRQGGRTLIIPGNSKKTQLFFERVFAIDPLVVLENLPTFTIIVSVGMDNSVSGV